MQVEDHTALVYCIVFLYVTDFQQQEVLPFVQIMYFTRTTTLTCKQRMSEHSNS